MATDISALLREVETHSADTPEFQDRSDAAACMFPIAPGSRLEYLEAVRLGQPPHRSAAGFDRGNFGCPASVVVRVGA